ncbi:MAG: ribonuclease III domain-containing protein [Waterburya sp.]
MNNTWESSPVENKIGINFKHDQTLRLALIHPSYAKQINEPEFDNQRLEYLGESILNLVVVNYLFEHFSHFQMGKLKALRDKITASDRLTQLWYDLGLGEAYPFLALKEERYRLRVKEQNPFEQAFKALVGAIHLDRGFSQTRNWLHKHLLVPLLKRYLKPDLEHSVSDKQLQLLGETLLEAIVRDYLYRQILQTNPNKLKTLARKLTSKDIQESYLQQLSTQDGQSIAPQQNQFKSLPLLLAQIYLQFESENYKSSFPQTSSYFTEHCLDDDEIMEQAIALLLKDGKPQKWIIHQMMGYPSNQYNEGRERFYELTGKQD